MQRSRKTWEVGQKVKAGFLSAVVLAAEVYSNGERTYLLRAANDMRTYRFTPWRGLRRIKTQLDLFN